MIKLNNKNITYVALADSSNSLKAPKEIWHADSSNSIKLVYRRKDALIEGEDYEKYHWLVEGGSGAYIQGISYDLWDNHLEVEIGKLPNSLQSKYISYPNFLIVFNVTGQAFQVIFRQNDSGYPHIADIYPYSSMPDTVTMDFYIENSLFYCNQNGVVKTNNPAQTAIESTWKSVTPQIYSAKMSYIREVLHNDTYRSNLIPCKLLKPVPKWLDANGIRRQVGECGMIDLVSGKFYGNVNSNGTFTVENYYERKEWLVGDGSAYIDTLHLANEGLDWETHVSNLSFKKHFVWNRHIADETPAISLYHSVFYNGSVRVQNNYTNSIYIQNQTNYDYIVATNSNGAVINGVQYIEQSASENISNKSIKLFYCDIDEHSKSTTVIPYGGNSQGVKCSYFRFLDSNRNYIQNLIPCTLTMDLPASMDANNIARTKGTSGMWDLVSDRFYGNVANSGTFKAVNLAEGVDYEAHQWLVGDGMAYINTKVKLHFATDSVYIKGRNNGVPTNDARYFGNYSGGQNAKSLELIYNKYVQNDTVNKQSAYDGRFRINPNSEFEFYTTPFSSTTSVTTIYDNIDTIFNVNLDDSYLNYEASNDLILLNTNDTRYCMKADVANFKVMRSSTIIRNLIPCKLLKAIPAKYDANGIARQAGECGMYDTVNDVFYGNVASSGSFSCVNDS